MPLKVRFRHGSAERVLDLPDRDKARPLIIGHDKKVDLRLPFEKCKGVTTDLLTNVTARVG